MLAAQGTRNLRGVFELTKALQEIDDIENKAQLCFTKFRHTITTNKWTFDSTKDNVVCGAFLLSSLLRELLNKTCCFSQMLVWLLIICLTVSLFSLLFFCNFSFGRSFSNWLFSHLGLS